MVNILKDFYRETMPKALLITFKCLLKQFFKDLLKKIVLVDFIQRKPSKGLLIAGRPLNVFLHLKDFESRLLKLHLRLCIDSISMVFFRPISMVRGLSEFFFMYRSFS